MLHVPYKGSAPAMTDLMGGQVNIAFSSIEPAIQLIKTNRIKPIAVTTLQKVNGLPNVPTIAESGLKDFDAAGWNGIVAPAGTPPDIIAILNQAVNTALRQPSIKAKMDSQGVVLDIQTPAQFGQTIRTETEKWATVIKKAQIKLD
jgi:tripartite-type tricarboxylate transporter receptor subunit TctC